MIGMTLTRDIGARMAVRPPRPPEVPRSRAVGCKSPAYDADEKSPTAWNKMDRMERVVSGKRCGCNGVGLPPLPGSHPNWQKSPGTRREPYYGTEGSTPPALSSPWALALAVMRARAMGGGWRRRARTAWRRRTTIAPVLTAPKLLRGGEGGRHGSNHPLDLLCVSCSERWHGTREGMVMPRCGRAR